VDVTSAQKILFIKKYAKIQNKKESKRLCLRAFVVILTKASSMMMIQMAPMVSRIKNTEQYK
jgi:hypothetical protein